MADVAWRANPPDEAAKEHAAENEDGDAEVVDLTEQRLLGWLRGMFGGEKKPPPDD